jgi:DNA-binding CsgD family transcriptional regulator
MLSPALAEIIGARREPQQGLALLRLAEGNGDAAAAAIRRVVGETGERLRRVRLLPAYVEIMLAVGDVEAAHSACRELEEISEGFPSEMLGAIVAHARGAVDLAEGDAGAALVALRRAWHVWQELEAPHEAARVRVLVGLACRALGDDDTAALELEAAGAVFAQVGAAPDLARVDSLAERVGDVDAHGLAARELQVLRLVAADATNKAIAAELVLSERTVDRHVSNILTKLGVSSRCGHGLRVRAPARLTALPWVESPTPRVAEAMRGLPHAWRAAARRLRAHPPTSRCPPRRPARLRPRARLRRPARRVVSGAFPCVRSVSGHECAPQPGRPTGTPGGEERLDQLVLAEVVGHDDHWKISVVQSPPWRRTSWARAGPSGRPWKSTKKSRSTSIPPSGWQFTFRSQERSSG